jgi:hypothetical protein
MSKPIIPVLASRAAFLERDCGASGRGHHRAVELLSIPFPGWHHRLQHPADAIYALRSAGSSGGSRSAALPVGASGSTIVTDVPRPRSESMITEPP